MPGMSVSRMSTMSTPWSLIAFMTSADVLQPNVIGSASFCSSLPRPGLAHGGGLARCIPRRRRRHRSHDASERVGAPLAGADAHRILDRRDEDLAVADAVGLGRLLD